MSRTGPAAFTGDLAATELLSGIEWLLWELCVEHGFCGMQAHLPGDDASAIISQRPALEGKAAEIVIVLRVTPRWMLGRVPLPSDVFAQAVLENESRAELGSLDRFRGTIRQIFEARFGPLLDPAPEETSAAISVLDRRDARFGWVV